MADFEEQKGNCVTAGDERAHTDPAVVGIGVCAASFRSLTELFEGLGPQTGAVFLIAVRQKEGLDVGRVVEALGSGSRLPVKLAADGEPLLADHIFVGAPDDMISIEDGHIRTRPAVEPVGHRGTFDSLLISLAEHAHERAVAVILAGLGSEGTAGVVATKKFGGLSIAAKADEAEPDIAQGATSPAAVADLHLPVSRIPAEITRYIRNLQPGAEADEPDEEGEEIEAQVTQIATILRNVTSHDFHGYKRGTFVRRIRRRMQVLQIERIEPYVERLRSDREEVQHLFQDLLIGVTQFFRDPAEFDALESEVRRLFEDKGPDDSFRVWVLGCATGEEAYSLAILLREHMETLESPPEAQIFATDLDARALSVARAGRYSHAAIADHVRKDRLDRWFVREGDTYCVSKELREMCIFSPHNVVKDAPFSRIDILSCRNLLIYLSTDLQNRVIPIFHFALRPGGVLFLGSSENVTRHQKLFAPVNRKCRIFRRLETATRIIPDFPLSSRPRTNEKSAVQPQQAHFDGRLSASISRQADAVAERYAPAHVVVDSHGEVLHFSGRTGRYLEPSAGSATLNLTNLVHRDIRLDVRSALQRAVAEGRRIEVPRLTLHLEDRVQAINLIVEPLSSSDVTTLVVVFQDLGSTPESGGGESDRLSTDEHVQRLEGELRVTRDRLQATIEELESTNEELKSSNEEYQSINEELQSANEEMETSKEELQSVNEELQTVNGELAHRVQELGRTNSDLKNLLESTQIATVFLDNDLRVRNFTPAATEVFHLLETDVGRPLDHVVSRVDYSGLQDDVRRVLKTLVPVDRQVIDPASNRHFAVRVLPYRSIDNYISGAVVTFTDLTTVRQAEAALRQSEEDYRILFEAIDEGFCIIELIFDAEDRPVDYRFLKANPEFVRQTGLTDAMGKTIRELVPQHDQHWFDIYGRIALTGEAQRFEEEAAALGRWYDVYAFRIGAPEERKVAVLFRDVLERRRMEQTLRDSERRQQVLIEGVPQLVWRAVDGGQWTWASPQWTNYTGQTEAASHGHGWLEAVHPDDRAVAREAWTQADKEGGFDVEYRICHAEDRSYRWFRTRAAPVRDESEAIVEWLGTSTDVHDMRELQKRQEVLVAELQHRVRNMLTVVRSVFGQTVASGSEIGDIADHFRGRLDALARTQVIVTRTAEGDVDLEDLIRDELLSVGATDESRIRVGGPDVALNSKTAEALGLAIHELTTNAVKYGALKFSGATLDITWSIEMDQGRNRRLALNWVEQGVPAVPTKPAREGFGRELIEEALPYRLGAETKLEFLGGGVRCHISVPLQAAQVENGRSEIRT